MSTREIFTTVSATGYAQTVYKSASFSVATVSRGKDTETAREKADKVLSAVMAVIKDLNKKSAGIDMKGLKCSYDSQPWHEYDNNTRENKHKGYVVTGSVVCTTEMVNAATAIMDALSTIDGATVQRPTFTADDTVETRSRAFMAAYNRAFEDFNLHCGVLGLDPDDYEVISYSSSPEQQHGGRVMATAASMVAEAPLSAPAEIKAGRAETSAYVQLTYVKKETPKKTRARATGATGTGNEGTGTARTSSMRQPTGQG